MPSSPHIHQSAGVGFIMQQVILALCPAIAVASYFFGWGVLVNIALASATAILAETIMLKLRQRPILPFLSDYSAVVTAVLLALCLPPLAPWWLAVLGSLFAMVLAKHLYGGLGYNPFNPAMIGFCILLISFPVQMTQWDYFNAPSLSDSLQVMFQQTPLNQWPVDSITGATPMDHLKTHLKSQPLDSALQALDKANLLPSWLWLNLAYLAGGLWLWYRRVIGWQIPAGVLAGLLIMASLFHLIHPDGNASPWFHLCTGATMIGAFFIATDPITAATTVKGRLYYGLGIGILTYVIRTWGSYPDGMAFAVLLMNMTAPMLDQYTQPRVFGTKRP